LEELTVFLSPFKDATLAVSRDTSPTIYEVAPHFATIKDSIKESPPSENPAFGAFQVN